MIRLTEVKLPLDHPEGDISSAIVKRLCIPADDLLNYRIFRRGVDARKKGNILFTYTLDVAVRDEAAILERQGCPADQPRQRLTLFPLDALIGMFLHTKQPQQDRFTVHAFRCLVEGKEPILPPDEFLTDPGIGHRLARRRAARAPIRCACGGRGGAAEARRRGPGRHRALARPARADRCILFPVARISGAKGR